MTWDGQATRQRRLERIDRMVTFAFSAGMVLAPALLIFLIYYCHG